MPIVGLTDARSFDPTRSMQLIAKIKKGSPKNEQGHMGRDLDYFRFDLQPQFEQYAGILRDIYSPEPTRFEDVIFISQEPDTAFDNWFEQWGGGQVLKCRCDGQTIVKHLPKGQHVHDYKPIPCVNKPERACGCKQVGRLSFILSKFSLQTGVYGYFMMETHSFYDISSIYQALQGVHNDFGNIRSVQWILERVKKEVNTPKQDRNGNVTGRIKTTKSLVNLRPSEDSIKRYILPKLQEQHLLPESAQVDQNLLQSSNSVDDFDDSDDDEQPQAAIGHVGINWDMVLEILQTQLNDSSISIADIVDALKIPMDDMETYSETLEHIVAVFALYWSQDYSGAKATAGVIARHDLVSLEDVMIELEQLEYHAL